MGKDGPRILVFDIETAPILGYFWKIWDENIGLNQIHTDWFVLSWAAKWLGEKTVMYMDQSSSKDLENDRAILQGIWKLLDEADVVITQNGKKFDVKKLYARFIINGLKPPSPFKHIDTKQLASTKFGFTSNSLEYLSDKLCKKYKKLKHKKFSGFELWKEVLKGNPSAWKEMKKYNIHDVLALEELYNVMAPWDKTDFNVFREDNENVCKCGSKHWQRAGFAYTNTGKFQRWVCVECGHRMQGRDNELSKAKRASLMKPIS